MLMVREWCRGASLRQRRLARDNESRVLMLLRSHQHTAYSIRDVSYELEIPIGAARGALLRLRQRGLALMTRRRGPRRVRLFSYRVQP